MHSSTTKHTSLTYHMEEWYLNETILQTNESLTSIASSDLFFCVGTTDCRLLIFATNGHFLSTLNLQDYVHPTVAMGSILKICIGVGGVVVVVTASGLVWCYDWQCDLLQCWSGKEDKISSIACTNAFDMKGNGMIYVAHKPSSIFSMRTTLSNNNRKSGNTNSNQGGKAVTKVVKESVLNVAWDEKDTVAPAIRFLHHEQGCLLFALHHQVFLCSEQGENIATFLQYNPFSARSRQNTLSSSTTHGIMNLDDGCPDPTASGEDTRSDCTAKITTPLATPGGERVTSQGKSTGILSDPVKSIKCVGESVLVQFMDCLYAFTRNQLPKKPFHIQHVLRLHSSHAFVATTGPHFVVFENHMKARPVCRVFSTSGREAQVISIRSQRQYASCVGMATSNVLCGKEVEGKNVFLATHIFVLLQHSVLCFRNITMAEQVASLCVRGLFPLAQHLCQQTLRWSGVVVEISSHYGSMLWKAGQRKEALRVWGEQVLPHATATFWDVFLQRLEGDGALQDIVPWLPFNDKSKVSASVYLKILTQALEERDFILVLSRVARWPVLYPAHRLQAQILTVLGSDYGFPSVPLRDALFEVGKKGQRCLLQLFRLKTKVEDANLGCRSDEKEGIIYSSNNAHNAKEEKETSDGEKVADASDGNNGMASIIVENEESTTRREVFLLLCSLFKLFQFQRRRLSMWQVLVWIKTLAASAPTSFIPVDVYAAHVDDEYCRKALARCIDHINDFGLWELGVDVFKNPSKKGKTGGGDTHNDILPSVAPESGAHDSDVYLLTPWNDDVSTIDDDILKLVRRNNKRK
eukprot:m.97871 g.97871  ORF g.97871 m.97871 type:complete len:807 (+) comp8997_c0_seq3:301-2721(+)